MQHLGYQSNTLQILPSAQPCHDYRTIVQHSRVSFRGIRVVLFALEIFWASHPALVLLVSVRQQIFVFSGLVIAVLTARPFQEQEEAGEAAGPAAGPGKG